MYTKSQISPASAVASSGDPLPEGGGVGKAPPRYLSRQRRESRQLKRGGLNLELAEITVIWLTATTNQAITLKQDYY